MKARSLRSAKICAMEESDSSGNDELSIAEKRELAAQRTPEGEDFRQGFLEAVKEMAVKMAETQFKLQLEFVLTLIDVEEDLVTPTRDPDDQEEGARFAELVQEYRYQYLEAMLRDTEQFLRVRRIERDSPPEKLDRKVAAELEQWNKGMRSTSKHANAAQWGPTETTPLIPPKRAPEKQQSEEDEISDEEFLARVDRGLQLRGEVMEENFLKYTGGGWSVLVFPANSLSDAVQRRIEVGNVVMSCIGALTGTSEHLLDPSYKSRKLVLYNSGRTRDEHFISLPMETELEDVARDPDKWKAIFDEFAADKELEGITSLQPLKGESWV